MSEVLSFIGGFITCGAVWAIWGVVKIYRRTRINKEQTIKIGITQSLYKRGLKMVSISFAEPTQMVSFDVDNARKVAVSLNKHARDLDEMNQLNAP